MHGIDAFEYLHFSVGFEYILEIQPGKRRTVRKVMVDPTCIAHIAYFDPDHF